MGAIVRESGTALSAIEVQAQALDVALRAASVLKQARGLLPEALKNEGEIVAVLLAGQELGLPPMSALRGLQVVKGKVVISYDTMIALLRRAGYRIEWLDSTSSRAALRLTAPDGSEHLESWDEARAKRAGLWGKGTWAQYPDTMLRARCVSSAARAFAGEVLAGVYVEEAGERIELEARGRPAPTSPAPRADVVDVAHEPDARALPTRLAELRDAEELRAWIATHWLAARDRLGEQAAGERVLGAARRLSLEEGEVTGWLAEATPVGEGEGA